MKILHTSDWHLGVGEANRNFIEDQRFFIDKICEIVTENSVDAVIIAGDIYDRATPSTEAIKLYDYAMTKLCNELKVKVFSVAGNHDGADKIANCKDLLSGSGLYIIGSLERNPRKVTFGDVNIYLLPWITEEKVKSVFPEEKDNIHSLEDAYRVVTNEIRKDFKSNEKNIIISHSFITNSETSTSDRAASIGFATQISANVFDGFDYVALGHIHKPQQVKDNIRYCGTPMPYSFGAEENQEKSVTIIDTTDMSQKIVPLSLLHVRKTIEGKWLDVINGNYDEKTKNGYIKVRILDEYVGYEKYEQLKEIFPNIFYASGKEYSENQNTNTLTSKELDNIGLNPIELLRHFCLEKLGNEISEHRIELFDSAIREVEEG